MWTLLIVLAILLVVIVFFDRQSTPPPSMPRYQVRMIVCYLILLGVLFIYLEIALLSVDFPVMLPVAPIPAITTETTAEAAPTPEPQQPAGEESPPASPSASQSPTPVPHPKIDFVIPQSTLGTAPDLWITVYGTNFPKDGRVRLNGVRQAVPDRASDALMIAKFAASDFLGRGSLTVDVMGVDNTVSNSVIIPIDKPTAPLNLLPGRPSIHKELQLLLVVIFAGALGTFVHTTKSAARHVANVRMEGSWFWWYITAPFVGAAMALIFYAVLRGGFLIGTPADEKFVSAFGVLVIGALVGMFSDKASIKLKDIFDTLFRSDAGDESAAAATARPSVSGPDTLPPGTQGTAYDQTFTATGGTQPYTWSVSSGNLPAGLDLDATTGQLSGTPTVIGAFQFTVNVADANGQSGEKPYELVVGT